jgi:hypothetical protein
VIGQVVEEVSGRLAQTINRLLQFEDQITLTLETCGLSHIDVFVGPKRGMNKRGSDVGLSRDEIHAGSQHHHRPNSGPLNDWSPRLEEVNTLYLSVTTYAETGFKFLGKAVREPLEAERPCTGKYMHPGLTRDELPSL